MNVLNLTEEQLQKYHMATLEQFLSDFGTSNDTERLYYETFLIRTDYLIVRAAEFMLMEENNNIDEILSVIKARKAARNRINELEQTEGVV